MHTLARSANYAILVDHDYVYLEQEGKRKQIGWMYGNAKSALIDFHEKWAVISGCGVWVMRLPLTQGESADNAPSVTRSDTFVGKAQAFAHVPFICLMDDAQGAFWPEMIYWADTEDGYTVRLIDEWNTVDEEDAGIFDLNLETLVIRKRANIIPIDEAGE